MNFFLGLIFLAAPFLLALSAGDPVPEFFAKNQDGKIVRLSDFHGKFVLLYFYPKDDTPGCTQEACSFRDAFSQFSKFNAVVLGISRQDEKSHLAFKRNHKLPFDLLVDTDGSLAKSLGIGMIPILGMIKRQSILIGPDSKVLRFYEDVDSAKHARQVLKDIESFGAPQTSPSSKP